MAAEAPASTDDSTAHDSDKASGEAAAAAEAETDLFLLLRPPLLRSLSFFGPSFLALTSAAAAAAVESPFSSISLSFARWEPFSLPASPSSSLSSPSSVASKTPKACSLKFEVPHQTGIPLKHLASNIMHRNSY